MMWLLDHNLPRQLYETLRSLSIPCETTDKRGWDELENGALVVAAEKSGFDCILTRDVLFGMSAAKALKKHPTMAVVLLRLPQAKGTVYATTFLSHWKKQKIIPNAGKLIEWP